MKLKLEKTAKVLSVVTLVIAFGVIVTTVFLVGYVRGYAFGKNDQIDIDQKTLSQIVSATSRPAVTKSSTSPTPTVVYVTPKPAAKITWGGPQLWEAVNKRRVELGVNPLSVKDEVCTIASIRLNELLALGQLDGHAGFSKLAERADIKPTFEKYNLSEFLVSGATSPQDAVGLWENTLGHKELLNGGQYVWGCVYAQNGFGVAIAAY
jgi:uncharacterized protein YkwD